MADTGTKEEIFTGDLSRSAELPTAIEDWNKEHVRDWILTLTDMDSKNANILYEQEINGPSLLLLDLSDLQNTGIKLGPAKLIIQKREELKAYQLNSSPGTSCKPYPFNQFHAAYRYKENCTLDVPETGNLNFIEPCHEYKAFVNCKNTEQKLIKFTTEVIRFASACMNSCTNGTIHFGVGDSVQSKFSHGQILGVSIEDKEAFVNELTKAIEVYFEHKHVDKAKLCIKTPRFVEVLKADLSDLSGKYVIEVDIEPSSVVCEDKYFHTYNNPKKLSKSKKRNTDQKDSGKSFYIRENGSSRDLLSQKCLKEYHKHVANMKRLAQVRKDAEEKHLAVIKNSVQYFNTITILIVDAVSDLQQNIEKECRKKNVSSKSPQVILLNCMRIDPGEQTEATDDTVFIGNKLSEMEQKSFEKKSEEIENIYKNAETFYFKPSKSRKLEDGVEKLSTLVTPYRASRAKHCLDQLTTTFNISKMQITKCPDVMYMTSFSSDKVNITSRNFLYGLKSKRYSLNQTLKDRLLRLGVFQLKPRPRGCKGGVNIQKKIKTFYGYRLQRAKQHLRTVNNELLKTVHCTDVHKWGFNQIYKAAKKRIRFLRYGDILKFGNWITSHSWCEVYEAKDITTKADVVYSTITNSMNTFFPTKSVKVFPNDRPWVSPNIKHLIGMLQKAFLSKKMKLRRHNRNKIQRSLGSANKTYYSNNEISLKSANSRQWHWEIRAKANTSRDETVINVPGCTGKDFKLTANIINKMFAKISSALPVLDTTKFAILLFICLLMSVTFLYWLILNTVKYNFCPK